MMKLSKAQYDQLAQGEWVALIYNFWEWKPLAILSLLIRIFTYGPNHAAIVANGEVHEMVGSNLWWLLKRAFGYQVSYEPNKGSGYKVTPLPEWLDKTHRRVLLYKPNAPLTPVPIISGYGFLDLLQFFLNIIRTKWLLIGHRWNGEDGVKLWKGVFCSEYIGLCLGRTDAHLLAPADLRIVPELTHQFDFET